MKDKKVSNKKHSMTVDAVIVGLGVTGLSCARFLSERGLSFAITDSRTEPPALAEIEQQFPNVKVSTGQLDQELILSAKQCLVSPGVSIREPALIKAEQAGVEVIGDIELFARHADAPVIAITGSNGKSTVTTLIYEMAKAAGLNVRAGGNLGTPALDLIEDNEPDLYVLELSSFQLETTHSLNPVVSTVLNISEDHMDRYESVVEYAAVKERVFQGSGAMVINADDATVGSMTNINRQLIRFTLNQPMKDEFGVAQKNNESWLVFGDRFLLAVSEMKIQGLHNVSNALAALALGKAVELDEKAMFSVLKEWPGLAHRCEWIAANDGVDWYNDSKGTNEGATVAAINGFSDRPIILIAGGDAKGAKFNDLAIAVKGRVKQAILFGKDAGILEEKLSEVTNTLIVEDLDKAVEAAAKIAVADDRVLLSPACASLDMFKNYIVRGNVFTQAVLDILPVEDEV